MTPDQASSPQRKRQLISRRHILRSIGAHATALQLLGGLDFPAASAADNYETLNRFPRMVHEFFVRQVRESGERHLDKLNQIQTKADAEEYVRDAQLRIRQAFGPQPERTPLSPRVTGTVERDTYRIENVIFDSRPGFPVTANLYIPRGHSAPMPAVVVRGSEETFQRLRRLYRLLDAEDNVALFYGPTGHGYSQENREAMYSWFNRATGTAAAKTDRTFDGVLQATADVKFTAEPEITIEKDETLWCTQRGQVAADENTRSVFDFTREKSKQLASARQELRGAALRRAVTDVLKLPENRQGAPDYRNWRYLGSRGYPTKHAMSYTVETEPGVQAIVYRLTTESWHSRPPRAGKRAILYVSHLSSDDELREEPFLRELLQAEPDSPVFACDVRGIGESLPDTCGPGSFQSSYGSDYFYAIHSLMLDRPYLGQKTFDVLRILDWLASVGHTNIHLVGRGWGALAATLAAVMSDQVKQVTLKNALTSYAEIAESERYDWPLSTLLPNVLAHFDLPDCFAELSSRNLRRIDSWGAETPS